MQEGKCVKRTCESVQNFSDEFRVEIVGQPRVYVDYVVLKCCDLYHSRNEM